MKSRRIRKGFSLIEAAIALAIAASAMVWTYSLITNGLSMQRKATNISNAVLLARIKMSQIDASSKMESGSTEGDVPGFRGYKFLTEIKEENLNLLELAGGGGDKVAGRPQELSNDKDSKLSELAKRKGKDLSQAKEAGEIKVFKITVKITYPDGNAERSYVVQTFKSVDF
ncbi:MAG: prepilin-type N-terminal cleavage/methylation domain-containing protein [Leptospiraceae bacterium]|nr:prepilin-type N-terminal cleavage/methylation domain-containing protein [Leptospiraceae bacterium]